MNKKLINNLIRQLKIENDPSCVVGGTVDSKSINRVSTDLNVSFNETYRDFLSEYGLFDITDNRLCGIWPNEPSEYSSGTVLFETKEFRSNIWQEAPKKLIVLNNTEDEWYEMLDNEDGLMYSFDPFSKNGQITQH